MAPHRENGLVGPTFFRDPDTRMAGLVLDGVTSVVQTGWTYCRTGWVRPPMIFPEDPEMDYRRY